MIYGKQAALQTHTMQITLVRAYLRECLPGFQKPASVAGRPVCGSENAGDL